MKKHIREMTKEEKKAYINEALETKGVEWVVAALIDGSIGYHTPKHALQLIKIFKEGAETDYCERCDAIFGGDLLSMLAADIYHMYRLEEIYPDKAKSVIDFVKRTAKLTDEQQSNVSLAYPTISW